MSNDHIKSPNMKTGYTEEQVKELLLASEDPLYFCRKFMKIQHAIKGQQPFEPFDFQTEMVQAFADHRFVVALTARQMGKTTCAAAYLLWKATFTPDCTILVAANKLNQATEIMERIKYGYADLPDYIKCGVTKFNEGTVSFDNGSKILARATTPDAGRGLSISVLYLDEFAFVPPRQAREFWTAIRPTLATGGDCIVTSTPNGDVDQFAQIYHGAIDNLDEYGNLSENGLGKNGFYGITVPWWRHPDRDEAWAQAERSQLGDERFRREYECVGGDTMLRLRDHDRTFVSTPLELFNRLKMIDQNVAAVR